MTEIEVANVKIGSWGLTGAKLIAEHSRDPLYHQAFANNLYRLNYLTSPNKLPTVQYLELVTAAAQQRTISQYYADSAAQLGLSAHATAQFTEWAGLQALTMFADEDNPVDRTVKLNKLSMQSYLFLQKLGTDLDMVRNRSNSVFISASENTAARMNDYPYMLLFELLRDRQPEADSELFHGNILPADVWEADREFESAILDKLVLIDKATLSNAKLTTPWERLVLVANNIGKRDESVEQELGVDRRQFKGCRADVAVAAILVLADRGVQFAPEFCSAVMAERLQKAHEHIEHFNVLRRRWNSPEAKIFKRAYPEVGSVINAYLRSGDISNIARGMVVRHHDNRHLGTFLSLEQTDDTSDSTKIKVVLGIARRYLFNRGVTAIKRFEGGVEGYLGEQILKQLEGPDPEFSDREKRRHGLFCTFLEFAIKKEYERLRGQAGDWERLFAFKKAKPGSTERELDVTASYKLWLAEDAVPLTILNLLEHVTAGKSLREFSEHLHSKDLTDDYKHGTTVIAAIFCERVLHAAFSNRYKRSLPIESPFSNRERLNRLRSLYKKNVAKLPPSDS